MPMRLFIRLLIFFVCPMFFASVCSWAAPVTSELKLAPLFRDHAVLQRDRPVPVWGRAEAGEEIVISFRGQTVRTVAAADGTWRVELAPLSASGEGKDLVAAGKTSVTLHDIVVGDVWLCAGQSNMGRNVGQALNPKEEIATAKFPLIRHIAVRDTLAEARAFDVGTTGWQRTTPETVARFTAVGYFFAREIHQQTSVPIGIVHSSFGGTRIEAWMSPAALASDSVFAAIGDDWKRDNVVSYAERKAAFDTALAAWEVSEKAARAAGADAHRQFVKDHRRPLAPITPQQAPSVLFNGMINPLVPYALRGVLWYQGESNGWAPVGDQHPAVDYRQQFPALIEAWRKHFERPDLPFYWVQLAGYGTSHDWATLRESQTLTLALPHTGQAIAIDVGDVGDIHPRNKQEVGHRLALIARAQTYEEKIEFSGPTLIAAERDGQIWRVRFDHARGGLVVRGESVTSLEIAGADRVFHPATARIDGDSLIVSSSDVREPAAVRYAWRSYPAANLYNTAGLPAVPFRTDNW